MTHANRPALTEALADHSSEGTRFSPPNRARWAQSSWVMIGLVRVRWPVLLRRPMCWSPPRAPQPEVRASTRRSTVSWSTLPPPPASRSPGDVLARLNARGAIEAASNAVQAQLKLEEAERDLKQFPEKKALLERKANTLRQAMELEQQQHEKRIALGTSRLEDVQRAQVNEARTTWRKPAAHAMRPGQRRTSSSACSRRRAAAGCRSCRSTPGRTHCSRPRMPTAWRRRESAK